MKLLKTILREAISTKCTKVSVAENSPPQLQVGNESSTIEGAGLIDAATLNELYSFVFRKKEDIDKILAGQTVRGILKVPTVGDLQLIAHSQGSKSLCFYLPPDGVKLFDADWDQLNQAQPAPGVPKATVASKPVDNPFDDKADLMAAPAIPTTPEPAQAPAPIAAQAPAPIAAQAPAPGGFVPDLGEAPVDAAFPPPSGINGSEMKPGEAIKISMPNDIGFDGAEQPAAPSAPEPVAANAIPVVESATEDPFTPVEPVAAPVEAAGIGAPIKIEMSPPPVETVEEVAAIPAQPAAAPAQPVVAPSPIVSQPINSTVGSCRINDILIDMVSKGASDLHLTANQPIALRIDGKVTRMGTDIVTESQVEQLVGEIIPPRNAKELDDVNDTDFAHPIDGTGRFRVNIFRDRNGIGTVIRHIPSEILTLDKLAVPPIVKELCLLSKGLVLVTGPTGSGKSTTLAGMLDSINASREDHIITIEDPIEFVHPQQKCLVNQREVFTHTTSFSAALRAALREDPDIVLIGEMRDLETIAIAIETAETGHLVFGTLHTTTAISTVDRIIDQFPADRQEQIRMMLAASIKGVVTQTLLKKKGGGRVAAHEILVVNDAVGAMIREGKTHMIGNHMQSQKAAGNKMLNEALTDLVKSGVVEADEALSKAVNRKDLEDRLKRAGIAVSPITAA